MASNPHLVAAGGHLVPSQQSAAAAAAAATTSGVEFDHAINYVNKIKSRFSTQPEVYKSFLEILHTYQKQQNNLKEGISPMNQNYLLETEIYAKVAKLFKNQEDLLIEFIQFLPEAYNNSANSFNASQQQQQQQQSQSLVNEFGNAQQQQTGQFPSTMSSSGGATVPSMSLLQSIQHQQQQQQQAVLVAAAQQLNIPTIINAAATSGKSSSTATSGSTNSATSNLITATVLPSAAASANKGSTTGASTIKLQDGSYKQQTGDAMQMAAGGLQRPITPQQQQRENSLAVNNHESVSKRGANFQQLPSKKQKMSNSSGGSGPKSMNISSMPINQPLQQQPPTSTTPSQQQQPSSKLNNQTNKMNILSNTQQLPQSKSTPSTPLSSHKQQQNRAPNRYSEAAVITERNFFDKLKRALRNQSVYENFLKCLCLFNQEVITRGELLKLTKPFLASFPNLSRWFTDYVESSASSCGPASAGGVGVGPLSNGPDDVVSTSLALSGMNPNKSQLLTNGGLGVVPAPGTSARGQRLNMPHSSGNIHMEIDYLSCKQYGASYRDISAYPQPISSGQTELCKQVLNATYVSFPSWSEDSTFISSKKNQYEELIFRIEDERFELDVVLESNQCTIRCLESVLAKLNNMAPSEAAKYRLDNTLGGTSEIIHVKAIQRIYGEKARDFVDALKSNPVVAVPLVLKRLKAKDEEWREAKKTMEKVWREQIEKNYLRSLDHCAAPFKQNDQKHLKAKSLVNEIETIYYERVEAKEEEEEQQQQQNPPSDRPTIQHNEPHLVFRYEDKSILEDAAALIIHHVKRQTAIQKEDKQKIKQIVYHFLPDLFFISRGALSDDESSEAPPPPPPPPKPQQQTSSGSDSLADESGKKLRSNVASMKSSTTQNNGLPNTASSSAGSGNPPTTPTRHTDTNKRRLTDVDFDKIQREIPTEYKTPDDLYRLLYVDEHWYLFVRYHQILCERLYKIYKQAQHQAEQERAESRSREQSVAEALKLRQKLDIAVDDFYPAFLDIVRNLLDNNMDSVQYEDTLREMFGIHAYIAFTLDKLVHNCVRQLQYLVQDDTSVAVKQLYHDEQRAAPNACGGKVSHMSHANVMAAELAYQKRAESLLNDQNVFKIISYKNSSRVTMELIDPQRDDEDDESNPDDIDVEKWSEYIEKYCSENSTANQQPQPPAQQTITDDLKSLLLKRPLFLTRNAHRLKCKFGVYKNKPATTTTTTTTTTTEKPSEETTQKTSDDTTAATTTTTTSITKPETNTTGEKEPGETTAVVAKKQPRYEPNETTCMYRRNGLKLARKSHHSVTKRMYDKFRKHTNKWLKENGLTADCIDDWLLGESSAANLAGTKTVCVKESIPKRTPYHVYYRYKVQSTVNNSSSKTDLTTLKKNASSASKLAENNSNNSNNGNNKKLKTQSSIDETTAAKSEPARTSPTPPQSQQQQE